MTATRTNLPLALVVITALADACGGAPPLAVAPWAPLSGVADLTTEYRAWLDRGRTPSRVVDFVRARSTRFRVVDVFDIRAARVRPGDRLLFINRDRTALLVIVGQGPLAAAGARIVAAHIDTPSPRLSVRGITLKRQTSLRAHGYGGMRSHHWAHLPLALVGKVARVGGRLVDVSLGLDDDYAVYIGEDGLRLHLGSTTAPESEAGAGPRRRPGRRERKRERFSPAAGPGPSVLELLQARYDLTADDLEAAELYLVPKHRAREVGFDRALIGAHGQDDRANSYVAWRAIVDLPATPAITAMAWLIDREEVGSTHAVGAESRFLELVFAYLLRAQGERVTEATLARAFARSRCLSADTPAALNPNWMQVHEPLNAPQLGKGPAMFPHTGRGGKRGGSQAHAELIASVVDAFRASSVPLQFGELGAVDEGGGGTVAKYLAHRGVDVVDVGVPVISMHSPMELAAKQDLWSAYRGFREWLRR